jgi:hypothetical protein
MVIGMGRPSFLAGEPKKVPAQVAKAVETVVLYH